MQHSLPTHLKTRISNFIIVFRHSSRYVYIAFEVVVFSVSFFLFSLCSTAYSNSSRIAIQSIAVDSKPLYCIYIVQLFRLVVDRFLFVPFSTSFNHFALICTILFIISMDACVSFGTPSRIIIERMRVVCTAAKRESAMECSSFSLECGWTRECSSNG